MEMVQKQVYWNVIVFIDIKAAKEIDLLEVKNLILANVIIQQRYGNQIMFAPAEEAPSEEDDL